MFLIFFNIYLCGSEWKISSLLFAENIFCICTNAYEPMKEPMQIKNHASRYAK